MEPLFERQKNNFDKLKSIIEERPIVLFLGAGVNAPFAPLWSELINSLLNKSLYNIPESYNNLEIEKTLTNSGDYYKATLIKNLLGEQYLMQLSYELYSKLGYTRGDLIGSYRNWKEMNKPFKHTGQFPNQKLSPTLLYEIAELCIKSRIHAVVTYNYDEYLSVLINSINGKKKAEDVFHIKQSLPIKENNLKIYHVHGFIPSDENLLNEQPENIVLAYDEYFQNMMEPYSWQTTTQLYFLMNYTCVFLGASLNDWNMLRILSNARKYSESVNHFAFFKSEESKGKRVLNRLKAMAFLDSGINLIIAGDTYEDIYNKINNINNEFRE